MYGIAIVCVPDIIAVRKKNKKISNLKLVLFVIQSSTKIYNAMLLQLYRNDIR